MGKCLLSKLFFFLLFNIFKCLSRWGVTLAKEKHEIPLIKSRLCCQAFPRSSITGMWQPQTSDSNPCWCQEDNSALYSHKDSTFLTPSLTNLCVDILSLWFCPSPVSKHVLKEKISPCVLHLQMFSFRLTPKQRCKDSFCTGLTNTEPVLAVLNHRDMTTFKRQIHIWMFYHR